MSINVLLRCHGCDRLVHVDISDAHINPPGELFFRLYDLGMDWSDMVVYFGAEYRCHECIERIFPNPYSNLDWRRYADFMRHHETYIRDQDQRQFLTDHPGFPHSIVGPAFAQPVELFSPTCSSCHLKYEICLGRGDNDLLNEILKTGGSNFRQYSQNALQGQGFRCWQCLRRNAAASSNIFMTNLAIFLLLHTIGTMDARPVVGPLQQVLPPPPPADAKKTLAIMPKSQTTSGLSSSGAAAIAEEAQRTGGSALIQPEIKLTSGAGTLAASGITVVAAGLQLYITVKEENTARQEGKPTRKVALATNTAKLAGNLSQITAGVLATADTAGVAVKAGSIGGATLGGLASGGAGILLGIISLGDGIRVSFNAANAMRASAELFTTLGSREFIRIIGEGHGITGPTPNWESLGDAKLKEMFWSFTHDSFWASAMWMAHTYHPSFMKDLLKSIEDVGVPALAICTSIVSVCVAAAIFPPIAGVAVGGLTIATIATESARLDRFRKSRQGYLEIMKGKVGGIAFTDPTIALCDLTFCEHPLGDWEKAFHKSLPTIHSVFSPKPTMGDYYRFTVAIYLYKAILEGHLSDDPPIEGFPTIKSGVSSARLSIFLDKVQNLQRKIRTGEIHIAPNFQPILANLSSIVNKLIQDSMIILFWNIIKHDVKRLVWKRAYEKAYDVARQEYMYEVLYWLNDMEEAYSLAFAPSMLSDIAESAAPGRAPPLSPEAAGPGRAPPPPPVFPGAAVSGRAPPPSPVFPRAAVSGRAPPPLSPGAAGPEFPPPRRVRRSSGAAAAAPAAAGPPAQTDFQFLIIPDLADLTLASPRAAAPTPQTPSEQKNSKIFQLPNGNRYTALELCVWASYNADVEANSNQVIRSRCFQYCAMTAAACVIAQNAHGISRLLTGRFPGLHMPQNLVPDPNFFFYNRLKFATINCLRLLYLIHPTRGTQAPDDPNTIDELTTLHTDVLTPLFDNAQAMFDSVNRIVEEYKVFQSANNARNTPEIHKERLDAIKKLCEILKR